MNNRLRALRVFAGKRQIDISAETGISQSRLSLIEGGLSRIRDEEKRAIANALGQKPEMLFPES